MVGYGILGSCNEEPSEVFLRFGRKSDGFGVTEGRNAIKNNSASQETTVARPSYLTNPIEPSHRPPLPRRAGAAGRIRSGCRNFKGSVVESEKKFRQSPERFAAGQRKSLCSVPRG